MLRGTLSWEGSRRVSLPTIQSRSKVKNRMSQNEHALPPHFQHNFVAFLMDYVFFGVAFAFVNPSTVLPAFASTLTDSEPLIGLVGTTVQAGWLLPQLVAAAVMGGRPRKKPYLKIANYSGRPLWFILALATILLSRSRPALMLWVLIASITLYFITDGVSSVAWFDILARAIPMSRRGRLIGIGQLFSGLLGIGVGALVGGILEAPSLPYPGNYALIFALSGVALIPATVALMSLREPEGEVGEEHRSLLDTLGQLGVVWREDTRFRRLVSYRWLVGLFNLALPFYVLHATAVVGLPEAATGWFVSAQMIGGIVASGLLGWLAERRGPRSVICVGALTAVLSPLLALALHFFRGTLISQAYLLVHFLFGITRNSWLLGPISYVMEMAPNGKRPLYIGLYNTLIGLLVPASFIGGVLLRITSYPVLFAVTVVGTAAGLWLSLGLKEQTPKGTA